MNRDKYIQHKTRVLLCHGGMITMNIHVGHIVKKALLLLHFEEEVEIYRMAGAELRFLGVLCAQNVTNAV